MNEAAKQYEETNVPFLDVPFPLRPNFTASVRIPTDLTAEEQNRLANFLYALVVPPKVADSADDSQRS